MSNVRENKQQYPAIRFAGFNDAWVQRNLSEAATITGGGTPSTSHPEYWDGDINWFTPAEIGSQTYVSESRKKISPLGLQKSSAKILPVGTILFTSRAGIGKTAILASEASTNQGFQSIVPDDTLDSYFVYSLTDKLARYGNKMGSGSTFDEISGKQLGKYLITLPEIEEQVQIGNLFKNLDNLIAANQKKDSKLRDFKKMLLQKMFVSGDAEEPEIRFNGFTDAWVQRKLGDLGKTKSGIGFPDAQQGGTEGTPFYKVSDMNNSGNEVIMTNANNYVSESQIIDNKWKTINPENSGVVFAKVGAAIFLDRKRIVDTLFLIDNNMMSYLFDSSWDRYFGKTLFEKLKLARFAQVGALPSFNGSDVEDIKVTVPETSEQEMVGKLFEQFDNLIAANQNKGEKLRALKKMLLQQMFV